MKSEKKFAREFTPVLLRHQWEFCPVCQEKLWDLIQDVRMSSEGYEIAQNSLLSTRSFELQVSHVDSLLRDALKRLELEKKKRGLLVRRHEREIGHLLSSQQNELCATREKFLAQELKYQGAYQEVRILNAQLQLDNERMQSEMLRLYKSTGEMACAHIEQLISAHDAVESSGRFITEQAAQISGLVRRDDSLLEANAELRSMWYRRRLSDQALIDAVPDCKEQVRLLKQELVRVRLNTVDGVLYDDSGNVHLNLQNLYEEYQEAKDANIENQSELQKLSLQNQNLSQQLQHFEELAEDLSQENDVLAERVHELEKMVGNE